MCKYNDIQYINMKQYYVFNTRISISISISNCACYIRAEGQSNVLL